MTAETNGSLSSLTLLTIPLTLTSMTIVKESLLAKKRGSHQVFNELNKKFDVLFFDMIDR